MMQIEIVMRKTGNKCAETILKGTHDDGRDHPNFCAVDDGLGKAAEVRNAKLYPVR
jgi:hypothetical protein